MVQYIKDYVIKKQKEYMDQQIRTRDSQRSITIDSIDDREWSESSHTYYYTKFQLFQDNEEINQFYRYSLFLSKLVKELGEEWRAQAHVLYQPYFNSHDIFMNLLSIWLQLHPVVNTVHQNPLSKQSQPVFNNTFIEEFITRMKKIHAQSQKKQVSDLKINMTSTKTVCMGFFITANQIWEEMFRNQIKSKNSAFSFFKGVSKKIQTSFEPLMVVRQKISNLFGRKKVKIDDSSYGVATSTENQKMFGDCYVEFRKTMGLQRELERKMSQFNLDEHDGEEDHVGIKTKKKIVTKGEFNHSEAPMEKNALGNLYDYVTKFLKKKHPWQVASSFVTNILDLNQQSMEEGTKVKVLKPAQDFYEKLIIGWLMMVKCQQQKKINFEQYLKHIQIAFGRAWREKYLIPTKYFYERLNKHWNEIQSQNMVIKKCQKQIMNTLIQKIRESMRQDWQRKIKIQKNERA